MPLQSSSDAIECGGPLHRYLKGYEGILYQQVIVYTKQGPDRQWRQLYGILDNAHHTLQLYADSENSSGLRSKSTDNDNNSSMNRNHRSFVNNEKRYLRDQYNTFLSEYTMDTNTLVYDIGGNIDGKGFIFYFSQPHLLKITKSRSFSTDEFQKKSEKQIDEVEVEEDFYLAAPNADEKQAWMEALIDACHSGFKWIHQPEILLRNESSSAEEDAGDPFFYPTVELLVYFNCGGTKGRAAAVENGNILKPSTVEQCPEVSFRSPDQTALQSKNRFTLILVDLDYPAETDEGPNRIYLHWCVFGLSGTDVHSGEEIAAYEPPAPPIHSGLHRYFFLLFKHKSAVNAAQIYETVEACSTRQNFPFARWTAKIGFGDPVGVNGFYSGWEAGYCDRIHANLRITPSEKHQSPAQKVQHLSANQQKEIEKAKADLYSELSLGDILPALSGGGGKGSTDALPSIELKIAYLRQDDTTEEGDFDVEIKEGNIIPASKALYPPTVHYNCTRSGSDTYFTLMLVDPDVPSRIKHNMREFVHWVVMNIPSDRVSDGVEVLPYCGVAAPYGSGLHRYVFLLFQQSSLLSEDHLRASAEHFKARKGLRTSSYLQTLRDNMGKTLIAGVPVGIEAFLSEWDTSVDNTHAAIGWMPPTAFLSPNQTLLAVNRRIDSANEEREKSLSKSLEREVGDHKYLEAEDRSENSSENLRSVDKEKEKEEKKKKEEEVYDDAENRLAAFYKSEFAQSSASFEGKYSLPRRVSFASLVTSPADTINQKGAPIAEDASPTRSPTQSGEEGQERTAALETSPVESSVIEDDGSENLGDDDLEEKTAEYEKGGVTSQHTTSDLCQIFGVSSAAIFDGEKIRKKYSSDYLHKESFIWVDAMKKSIHWSKVTVGKDPSKSKYISFVHNSGSGIGGIQRTQNPLGEYKGVVNSVDSIAGGILLSLETGEHLELKISQQNLLAEMMKVLRELFASMRYGDLLATRSPTKVIYFS